MAMQPTNIVSSSGLEITDTAQRTATDMVAAFASALGHRHADVVAAITSAGQSHLGCGHDRVLNNRWEGAAEPFTEFAAASLVPSASEANEWAIRIARVVGSGNGGSDRRYRIVTLLGGDHGDTLACRSASGRIADQAVGGPLVAGFRHVAAGDVRALKNVVDSSTAAVLLSPLDWSRGGEPFAGDYLLEVRRVCDASGALLIIDETRAPAAISGQWFFHQIHALHGDIVTASAGWTGGLPGGLVLVSDAVSERLVALAAGRGREAGSVQEDAAEESTAAAGGGFSLPAAGLLPDRDYPVLRAVVQATAAAVQELGGPAHVREVAQRWADAWQTLATDFEFISDVVTAGLWAVVQLDLPAKEMAAAASNSGLKLLTSGQTSLLACLPINVTAQQLGQMLGTFREALETMERQTIES